jgi:tetratricopeptide (TPR) repeat protein
LLAALGRWDKAAGEYRVALRLEPKQVETHSDLADALSSQGKTAQAVEEFRQALVIDSDFAPAHLGLGLILARQGSMAEARQHLQKAANSADPDIRESAARALR